MTSALEGFTRFEFDDGRWTREVWRIGTGPAVIVMHEIPGLHPGVLAFARDVAAAGGQAPTNRDGSRRSYPPPSDQRQKRTLMSAP